jgi:nucleoside-triphosphatase
MKKNVLLTGSPGCGKTTLIEKIASRIETPVAGFLTREIREAGSRVGFSIETFDGRKGLLALVGEEGHHRVGRYGVRIETLEAVAVPSLSVNSRNTLVVIDEIGKMECLSSAFRRAVLDLLDSRSVVLASIAKRGDAFMEGIKSRADVTLHEVTIANRDGLVASIAGELRLMLEEEGT